MDSYHWLRERDKPEVVDYLRTENDYTAAVLRHTEGLQTALFEEIKGRIKQTDMSVPYREADYYYYTRFEAGKEYPIHLPEANIRWPGTGHPRCQRDGDGI